MPKKTFRQKRGSKRTSKKRASQRGGVKITFEKRARDRQTPGKRKYTLSSPPTTTSISQPPIFMENNVAHPFSIFRTENPGLFEPRGITRKQQEERRMQKQAEKEAEKKKQQAELVAQLKHLEDEQNQAQLQHQAQLLEDEQQRKNLHKLVIEAFIVELNELIDSNDSNTCYTFFNNNEERIKKLNDPSLDKFFDNNGKYIVSSIINCICFGNGNNLTHEGREFIKYVGSLRPHTPVVVNGNTETKYRRIIENPVYLLALNASRQPHFTKPNNPNWYDRKLW